MQFNKGESMNTVEFKAFSRRPVVFVVNEKSIQFHAKPMRLPVRSRSVFVKSGPLNGNMSETKRISKIITGIIIAVSIL